MIKAMRLLALSAVGVAMLACSSKSGSTEAKDAGEKKDGAMTEKDAGEDAGGVLGSLCAEIVQSQAQLYSMCLTGPEASWAAAFNVTGTCNQLQAAVTAGSVTFNASQASACVSAVKMLTCPPESASVVASFSACGMALGGTVMAGGSCRLDVECAGDSFCSGLYAKDAPCAGTCKTKVAKGQPCGAGDECVAGYECSGTGTNLTCVTTTSLKTAAVGDTCGYDATTKVLTECSTGLACNAKTLKCVTPVAIGAACTPGASECETFAYCDPTQTKCLAYPGLGGDCGAEEGEDLIECAAPYYCQLASTMSTYAAGKCAAAQQDTGAPCRADVDCASGRCDVGDAGKGACLAPCSSGQ